jgi:hypothetical protein
MQAPFRMLESYNIHGLQRKYGNSGTFVPPGREKSAWAASVHEVLREVERGELEVGVTQVSQAVH